MIERYYYDHVKEVESSPEIEDFLLKTFMFDIEDLTPVQARKFEDQIICSVRIIKKYYCSFESEIEKLEDYFFDLKNNII